MDGTPPAIEHDKYSDAYIRGILSEVKTIAMVGSSTNWNRPSFFAMKYLQQKDYRVIPVNPMAHGEKILGEPVFKCLADIEENIDMVDLFRKSEDCLPYADEAARIGAKVLWLQIGVWNDEAARIAEEAGLKVVMNRCPKIEYARLHGELGWNGINSGVISSKKRKIR
ncbi:MAG: CoA-binding protein [Proteobacteria bacterium]|nr:CoA-binding protein [Pseudomonadota bacterium]MCK4868124.1 CoA-binding protein [Alphaproteobacteria bacterium]